MARPLFVAAVRQHVGKTTVSLALMNGLRKRFGKVGQPHRAHALLRITAPTHTHALHLHVSHTDTHLHCDLAKVGFIKPVGQQHVNVEHNGEMVRVDKDVQLMKECVTMPARLGLGLGSASWAAGRELGPPAGLGLGSACDHTRSRTLT